MEKISLPLQTLYAELLERCSLSSGLRDFPVGGSFYQQEQKGRKYWYFQWSDPGSGKKQNRYVGPDTERIRNVVSAHALGKDDYKARRQMVSALKRAGLAGPQRLVGQVLSALADAGVFRLRAVVVGTTAFQSYQGMLGVRFRGATLQTGDIDIAQFPCISIAVGDSLGTPFLDVLKTVDPRFDNVPGLDPGNPSTQFALGKELRIEILTPFRGREPDVPTALPALGASGTSLRFLDYLVYQEKAAVVLHGGGVLVNVPEPERFALHKLIVSQRRLATADGRAKSRKDIAQAQQLIEALCAISPEELRDAWEELWARGPSWREHVARAVRLLTPGSRESLAACLGSSPWEAPPVAADRGIQPH